MNEQLVVVRQFNSIAEHDRAKAALASHGIVASSENEASVQMQPHRAMAMGGVRLLVPSFCEARARSVLSAMHQGVEERNYAHRVRRSKLAALLAALVGIAVGALLGIRSSSFQTGASGGLLAGFVAFLYFGWFLVPKAELIRK